MKLKSKKLGSAVKGLGGVKSGAVGPIRRSPFLGGAIVKKGR